MIKLALFRKVEKSEASPFGIPSPFGLLNPYNFEVEGDEWKGKKKKGYTYDFVCFGTAKEIASCIRDNPSQNFRVMQGEIHEVKSMSTFFVKGKNLDTMEAEWS